MKQIRKKQSGAVQKGVALCAVFGLLAVIGAMLPDVALAQAPGVGKEPLLDVYGQVVGNIGTLIGLAIALFGLWIWLINGTSWGVVMILGGVAVTAFPGLWGAMQDGFQVAFNDSGASVAQGEKLRGGGGGGGGLFDGNRPGK